MERTYETTTYFKMEGRGMDKSTSLATAILVETIDLDHPSTCLVKVDFQCSNADCTKAAGGMSKATIAFPNGGGVPTRVCSGGGDGIYQESDGNFTGTQPYVDIVPNTSTNKAEIYVVAGTTEALDWHLDVSFTRKRTPSL